VRLAAKVESFFRISGRGAVIVPAWVSDCKVKAGDSIQLRSANGRVRDTQIVSVELLKQTDGGSRAAFLLAPGITGDEITEGTEIWLIDMPTQQLSGRDSKLG
jgi:translation elongation factor EF-Tu-like GTPase